MLLKLNTFFFINGLPLSTPAVFRPCYIYLSELELPLVSPFGDLTQRKVDYRRTNEVKNLKIANPQAFTAE